MTTIFNEKAKVTNTSEEPVPVSMGDSTPEVQQLAVTQILYDILSELKKLNIQASLMTDAEIKDTEIE